MANSSNLCDTFKSNLLDAAQNIHTEPSVNHVRVDGQNGTEVHVDTSSGHVEPPTGDADSCGSAQGTGVVKGFVARNKGLLFFLGVCIVFAIALFVFYMYKKRSRQGKQDAKISPLDKDSPNANQGLLTTQEGHKTPSMAQAYLASDEDSDDGETDHVQEPVSEQQKTQDIMNAQTLSAANASQQRMLAYIKQREEHARATRQLAEQARAAPASLVSAPSPTEETRHVQSPRIEVVCDGSDKEGVCKVQNSSPSSEQQTSHSPPSTTSNIEKTAQSAVKEHIEHLQPLALDAQKQATSTEARGSDAQNTPRNAKDVPETASMTKAVPQAPASTDSVRAVNQAIDEVLAQQSTEASAPQS